MCLTPFKLTISMNTNWQPIDTAPKDGTKIDIWAKTWAASSDTFQFERFTNCLWMKGDSMSGSSARWLNVPTSYHPTHWMPLPEPPVVA